MVSHSLNDYSHSPLSNFFFFLDESSEVESHFICEKLIFVLSRVPMVAEQVKNLTGLCEDVGLISGLTSW